MTIPQEVTDRVHCIAELQKCPPELVFTQQDGTPYTDEDDDTSVPDDDDEDINNNTDDDNAENEGVPIDNIPDGTEEIFEDAMKHYDEKNQDDDQLHEEINISPHDNDLAEAEPTEVADENREHTGVDENSNIDNNDTPAVAVMR